MVVVLDVHLHNNNAHKKYCLNTEVEVFSAGGAVSLAPRCPRLAGQILIDTLTSRWFNRCHTWGEEQEWASWAMDTIYEIKKLCVDTDTTEGTVWASVKFCIIFRSAGVGRPDYITLVARATQTNTHLVARNLQGVWVAWSCIQNRTKGHVGLTQLPQPW